MNDSGSSSAPHSSPSSTDRTAGATCDAAPGREAGCQELHDVRAGELQEIGIRRDVAGLPEDAGANLVGLSLSGGGLRSACFGLGFVQALHRSGLWRYIDYLSTVSGGGYIGAYLSSKVVREERAFDKDYFPLATDKNGRQSPDTQKFIYGGNLFYRPFALLNKYLIGLFFINLTFVSAIVAIGALIAFLWRCFDQNKVGEATANCRQDKGLAAR